MGEVNRLRLEHAVRSFEKLQALNLSSFAHMD